MSHSPISTPGVLTPMARPVANRTAAWVAVIILLTLCALAVAVVVGLTTGPVGAVVGLVLALLPVYPVAAALLWLDRYESEPRSLLIFAFVWGATAAVVISLLFSIGGMVAISARGGSEVYAATVVAPIVEEIAKGLAVIGVLVLRRREFDGVVDGIVYAGLSGLGFAFAENILYIGSAFLDGGLGAAFLLFVVRGVMGPFAHPMFTAAFGIGVGLAVQERRGVGTLLYPLLGLAVAMGMHSLWNTLATGANFWAGYLMLQVPLFLAFVNFAVWARRREGRLIAEHLRPYVTTGWLTDDDLAMLASLPERRRARRWAQFSHGVGGEQAMSQYQELGSELAFLRERMAHGTAPPDAQECEISLLGAMWRIREDLVRPPQVPMAWQ